MCGSSSFLEAHGIVCGVPSGIDWKFMLNLDFGPMLINMFLSLLLYVYVYDC